MRGMTKQQWLDNMKRYAKPYMVHMREREPVIIAAYDDKKAWIQAAEILGIDLNELYDRGLVRRVFEDENILGIRRAGQTEIMTVHNSNYGTKKILAVCREDAVRQAAQMWNCELYEIMKPNTRVKTEKEN